MKIYKCFIWFFMLAKRLLCKPSFVILLCLIPLCVILTNGVMKQESGVFHVMLCNEGQSEQAINIIESLMNENGVIRFSVSDSAEHSRMAVEKREVDAAWIFPSDFEEKMNLYASDESNKPFIKVIEAEGSVACAIAREKLFGAVYKYYSRAIYEGFSYKELVDRDEVSVQEVRSYYDKLERSGSIIRIERLDGTTTDERKVTYLTAPLRGILSLMVVLCALASLMCFLKEQSDGKYAWLSPRRRILPAMASALAASLLSGLAIWCAVELSGISMGFFRELASMLLLVLSTTGVCMILSVFISSPGKLGAMLPGMIIAMLVLSPIFFNLKVLRPLRLILPTYYYLQSVYNVKYYFYSIIFTVVIWVIGLTANYIFAGRKHRSIVVF